MINLTLLFLSCGIALNSTNSAAYSKSIGGTRSETIFVPEEREVYEL